MHVNGFDRFGGAARATYRIHQGLLTGGVSSELLVSEKHSDDFTVKLIPSIAPRLKIKLARTIIRLQKSRNGVLHSLNILPGNALRLVNGEHIDIAHLHWIGNETMSISEISRIKKPIVWTLHDMWAFCGTEHLDDAATPGRYIEGYFSGNRPKSHTGLDVDRMVWQRKKKLWQGKRFTIVTPSRWLGSCATRSALFEGLRIETIPNGLDLDRYRAIDRGWAKKIWRIPSDRKLILFGAEYAIQDSNKGFDYLNIALGRLTQKSRDDLELMVFGASRPEAPPDFGVATRYLGRLHDDVSLALLYAAADVLVVPSLQENLPNTIAEGLACGTPCVAFNIGGLPEMIDHQQNGYLAQPYEAEDLANGVNWVLADPERYSMLRDKARKKAEEKFDINKVARRYSDLYMELIEERQGSGLV